MIASRSAAAIASIVLFAATSSCSDDQAEPRPQWLVTISTDAIIPQMGDRLLVELLTESGDELACTGCRRDAVAGHARNWPASFGIEPTPSALLLRVRLYRGDHIDANGQPIEGTTIDMLGRLPSVGAESVPVGVHLTVDCIGKQVDLQSKTTCIDKDQLGQPAPVLGAPQSSGGTTHYLEKINRGCPEQHASYGEMACVPGGIFFLGDALAPAPHSDVHAAPAPERLVGLDSFLLDRREVTVSELFSYVQPVYGLGPNDCPPEGLDCHSDLTTREAQRYCTYDVRTEGRSPSTDARPVNCITRELAAKYCAAMGKRLPLEAEWEYAASNGMRETRFSWGNTPPSCATAYLGRGIQSAIRVDSTECLGDAATVGPVPWDELPRATNAESPADLALPWLEQPSHGVFALAGNVAEWTADHFYPYGTQGSCWDSVEPVLIIRPGPKGAWCEPPSELAPGEQARTAVRGGSWREPLEAAWSASRAHAPSAKQQVPMPELGFRCAKSL